MHLQIAGKTYPEFFIPLLRTEKCQARLRQQIKNILHDEVFHEQLARMGEENLPKQMGRQHVLKIAVNF